MFKAKDKNGQIVPIANAFKENKYFCPDCDSPLIIRRGEIKVEHFAHLKQSNCAYSLLDSSEWANEMVNLFSEESREVLYKENDVKFVAPVSINNTIVNFIGTDSKINEDYFDAFTRFFMEKGKNVVWLFNATEQKKKYDFRKDDGNLIKLNYYKWIGVKRFLKYKWEDETTKVRIFVDITEGTDERVLHYLIFDQYNNTYAFRPEKPYDYKDFVNYCTYFEELDPNLPKFTDLKRWNEDDYGKNKRSYSNNYGSDVTNIAEKEENPETVERKTIYDLCQTSFESIVVENEYGIRYLVRVSNGKPESWKKDNGYWDIVGSRTYKKENKFMYEKKTFIPYAGRPYWILVHSK